MGGKRMENIEKIVRNMWDIEKRKNIYVVEVLEEEEIENSIDIIFEVIMVKNFLKLKKL